MSLLLAMDVDDAIGLIFVLIAFISWVVNAISGKSVKRPPAAARPRPPVRPNPDPLHQEINIFIQDLLPDKPAASPPRGKTGKNQGRPAADNSPRRSKPRRTAPAGAPAKPAAPRVSPPATRSMRPGGQVANRPLPGSGTLGAGIRTQIESDAREHRIQQQVGRDLSDRINAGVAEHLGTFTASSAAESANRPVSTTVQSVATLLRTPATVRQAILIQTILSAPPGLRGARNS
jgi:hypothetical protein